MATTVSLVRRMPLRDLITGRLPHRSECWIFRFVVVEGGRRFEGRAPADRRPGPGRCRTGHGVAGPPERRRRGGDPGHRLRPPRSPAYSCSGREPSAFRSPGRRRTCPSTRCRVGGGGGRRPPAPAPPRLPDRGDHRLCRVDERLTLGRGRDAVFYRGLHLTDERFQQMDGGLCPGEVSVRSERDEIAAGRNARMGRECGPEAGEEPGPDHHRVESARYGPSSSSSGSDGSS